MAAWMTHQVVCKVALRVRLARAGGGTGTYATFGVQRAATRFIALHAPGRTVLISEEHLDPRARGIDFRYWFLLWTFDHDIERFFPADRTQAEFWYVIRNTQIDVRSEFDAFLASYPWRAFGFLRVYVIPRPGPWPSFVGERG
jgi:hypothetical protein